MTHNTCRTLLLLLLAAALPLSAQTLKSDVGIWAVATRGNDSFLGNQHIYPSDRLGYGISFNRFWTDRFSTELSVQRFSATSAVRHYIGPDAWLVDSGTVDATAFTATAQWHFNRDGLFSPYLGAGLTHLLTEFEGYQDGWGYSEIEVAPSAAAGVNVRVTDRIYLAGEVKTVPRLSFVEGGGGDVDPVSFSAGFKVRF